MKFIACIIALVLVCSLVVSACAEYYPLLTIVISTTKINDEWRVDCMDSCGNIWTFMDFEDFWHEGDLANLLMDARGDEPFDDEIIEVYEENFFIDLLRGN